MAVQDADIALKNVDIFSGIHLPTRGSVAVMLKTLLSIVFDVDEPPTRPGWPGFIILAAFGMFCLYVWFNHPTH